MALLAEEIVEEWLNRLGFFRIRGVKIGVHEIDLLAVRLAHPSGMSPRGGPGERATGQLRHQSA